MRLFKLLIVSIVLSANAWAETVTFVTCPIYRDTDSGRKSGCWLADDPATQIRYDVSAAPMKPLLGKKILVEGVVSDDSNACGGTPLRPVRTSILDQACEAVMIPAEGFAGRRFAVPSDAQRPTWEARQLPPPPYITTEFHIFFNHDSDFLVYQHAEIVMEKALLYAKASHAREVQVIGYAVTKPVTASGERFKESIVLARSRAEAVRLSLNRLGIEPAQLKVSWKASGQPVESPMIPTATASLRRVTIRVIPAASQR
ncbi:MAG: OmpA family protein [Steroidobacter sp.]